MPDYNLMQDEKLLIDGTMSYIIAAIENLVLTFVTFFIAPYFIAKNSGVAVTDQRIIIKEGGILGATTHEIRLDNIQGASQTGNTLTVSNAAGEQYQITVDNAGDIRNEINRAQNK